MCLGLPQLQHTVERHPRNNVAVEEAPQEHILRPSLVKPSADQNGGTTDNVAIIDGHKATDNILPLRILSSSPSVDK